MKKKISLIEGIGDRFLLSPKGYIEGFLVKVKGKTIQVSISKKDGIAISRHMLPGKKWRVLGVADRSSNTKGAAHPVYRFKSLADASGAAIDWPDPDDAQVTISGEVAAFHFSKYGKPNGVILKTGDVIRLRPSDIADLDTNTGFKIRASGSQRMTVLNIPMLDAKNVHYTVSH